MQKLLKLSLLVLLTPLVLLSLLIIDLSPLVQVSSSEQVNEAQSVNILLNQARKVVQNRNVPHQIALSSAQANSLAGFLQRAGLNVQAKVVFEQDIAVVKTSYHVGHFITDYYINVEMNMLSGPGLQIEDLTIGDLSVPGAWALKLAEVIFNWKTQSSAATEALQWVDKMAITADLIEISVKPSENLILSLKNMQGSEDSKQTKLLKAQIVYYLEFLSDTSRASNKPNASLAYYLSALMQEAQSESQFSNAATENEAAILALAIYAGNYRFARLIGQLSIAVEDLPTARRPVVIKGRTDLSLHFVYSAAIKLLSEKGVSIAVGEFKELMDRGEGGSGYSFIDLAADLAGAHFAELAISPDYASQIQSILIASPFETSFFPSTTMLDEGLNTQAFESKYQAVDSPAYQAAVDLINQRIAQLPISGN